MLSIDINQIAQWLLTFILSPAGTIVLIGIATIFVLKFLSGKAKDVQYVKAILVSVHDLLADQLGDKAEAVYQAWLQGLDFIADGDFTPSEMVQELVQFIKIALGKQNIALSVEEQSVIMQAAAMSTPAIMSISNTKSTKKAVSIMMVKGDK